MFLQLVGPRMLSNRRQRQLALSLHTMSVLRLYSLLVELQLLTGVHCGVLLTAAGNALSIGPGAAGDVC